MIFEHSFLNETNLIFTCKFYYITFFLFFFFFLENRDDQDRRERETLFSRYENRRSLSRH